MAFQKALAEMIDPVMEEKISTIVGEKVSQATKDLVQLMRAERALYGKDRSGLDEEQKKSFLDSVYAASYNGKTKSGEALIEEQDDRGGYLVPKEVANAIVRIAATVGYVMSKAQKWPMGTDELGIPNYTGAFLEGEYLDVDTAGSLTPLTFGSAKLIIKKWQLAFAVGNDLMADSPVELADWLLALAAEALANRIDKEAFVGTGAPFVGILNHKDVPTYTMKTGNTGFADMTVDDVSRADGALEDSVSDGADVLMHKSVWAEFRIQKDGNGAYLLPQQGVPTTVLMDNYTGLVGAARPAGEALGKPVHTIRHLPKLSASAVSTPFATIGNFKAMAYGDRGEMRVEEFKSGNFGGKEIALADQRGLVYRHRHALTITLPKAFTKIRTAAS